MIYLIGFALVFLFIGVFLFVLSKLHRDRLGVVSNEVVYQDSNITPGKVMYAKSLPLVGKPDYLIKQGESIIPVEVKSGRTPTSPYDNHIAQLGSYLILVEENYNSAPTYGYIRYPEKEFKIEYTEELKQWIISLVSEVQESKSSNREYTCEHPEHNNF